jgi:ubiquinone/menaquinone biosynthesis C-methylase UbiE
MAELSTVLARRDEFPFKFRLDPQERALPAGYAEWAEMYDGPNPLIETEELVVRPILERVAEPGVQALDAACGTGRHAAYLHDRGCTVTGVDQSLEMLAVARNKLPGVHFEQGDIEQLAFADGSFDLVVIALALCHLADPTAAVAELARVLRPGGTLVIADPHPAAGVVGGQAFYGSIVPGRPMTWVRNHYHQASTWLRAFRAAGLQVDDCIEPPMGAAQIASSPASRVFPDATRIAVEDLPGLWVWELRRSFSEG